MPRRTLLHRPPARGPALRAAAVAALLLATMLAAGGRAGLVERVSWIDAPLDGSVLPLAPVSIVTHTAEQDGVQEVRLEVDGILAVAVPGDGSRLFTGRFTWDPPEPGTYLLSVVGRGPGDAWGAAASASVVITEGAFRPEPPSPSPSVEPSSSPEPSPSAGASDGPSSSATPSASAGTTPTPPRATPTPTPAPTPTPTPAPTPTPTPTPCTPPAPTLLSPVGGVIVRANPPTLEWTDTDSPGCRVTGYDVFIEGPSFADQQLGWPRTTWTPPPLPVGRTCTLYQWHVRSVGLGGPGPVSRIAEFQVCP